MRKIEKLFLTGYHVVHKTTGVGFGTVAETTAMAKRRYTETANYEPYAKANGMEPKVKFDKQQDFGLYQMINPVVLVQELERMRGTFGNADDIIDVLQENLKEGCIK